MTTTTPPALPKESNDTIAKATDTGITFDKPGHYTASGAIGDNSNVAPELDVDLFKVQLDAGDRLVVDIDASQFELPLDAVLRVFDSTGKEIAVSDNDRAPGEPFSLDPFIDLTAANTGTFYIGISGFDNLNYNPSTQGSGSTSFTGNTGDYNISFLVAPPTVRSGTSGDDVLVGTEGNDRISGLGGDDDIIGLGGRDTIFGGAGDDLVDAGASNDRVEGGDGNDDLSGGFGDDTLLGGNGLDIIFGGGDNDQIKGGTGTDRLFGEGGNDSISGEDGNDNINGGEGFDTISGGAGNDNIFGGNDGFIFFPIDKTSFPVFVSGDFIKGEGGNDRINGGEGDDTLNGGIGNDNLFGGSGFFNDNLFGDDGTDRLTGGEGFDTLDGGKGNDTLIGVSTSAGFGQFEIDILTGGLGKDLFLLGNSDRRFYDDGDAATSGDFDYGLITDLNLSEDIVQLKGPANFYSLDFFISSSGTTDAAIIYDPGPSARGEVIGVIQNAASDLSLSNPAFVFV
jgi:Ca2+-binding RTX toxin-like protein